MPPVAKESGAFAEARGLRLEEAKGGNEICRLWWKEAGLCRSVGLRLEEARESKEICRLCGRKRAFAEARGLRLEEARGGKRFAAFVEENGPSQKRGACGWKKQKEAKRFAAFGGRKRGFAEAGGLRLEEARGNKETCRLWRKKAGPSQKRGACGWKKQ